MSEICPDCGRDLTELNKTIWRDFCHYRLGSHDVCLPPPTKEEIEEFVSRPYIAPLVKLLHDRLEKTLSRLTDVILEHK